ncbi:MAG: hypothetical protein AAGD10_21705 [Myxococcota bacterium]
MKRPPIGLLALLFVLCSVLAAGSAQAAGRGQTRLSVPLGVSVPHQSGDWNPAFTWGFGVDLPLVDWFYLAPSALVYELNPEDRSGTSATDVALSYKFALTVDFVELQLGPTTGLTSSTELDFHFGGVAAAHFGIAKNFDLTAMVVYKVILLDEGNVNDVKILAGPAFRF